MIPDRKGEGKIVSSRKLEGRLHGWKMSAVRENSRVEIEVGRGDAVKNGSC